MLTWNIINSKRYAVSQRMYNMYTYKRILRKKGHRFSFLLLVYLAVVWLVCVCISMEEKIRTIRKERTKIMLWSDERKVHGTVTFSPFGSLSVTILLLFVCCWCFKCCYCSAVPLIRMGGVRFFSLISHYGRIFVIGYFGHFKFKKGTLYLCCYLSPPPVYACTSVLSV